MIPWIAEDVAPYFSLLSLTAALAACEHLVRRGTHRGLVTAVYGGAVAAGAGLLLASIAAYAMGQPWFVWFALGLPGAAMTGVFGMSLMRLPADYGEAELRRSIAKDI